MNLQGQRDLVLLSEFERDGNVTQRTLATKLGVALGLTNLYIKRLARKGFIKITTIPPHRIKYILTPQGFAEKSRLTYQYMQYSLTYYRDMRARLRKTLAAAANDGAKRVVIYGTGELAEMAYLSLREMNVAIVGFVDGGQKKTFLSYPVMSIQSLTDCQFDTLLIAELDQTKDLLARLMREGISRDKIINFDGISSGSSAGE